MLLLSINNAFALQKMRHFQQRSIRIKKTFGLDIGEFLDTTLMIRPVSKPVSKPINTSLLATPDEATDHVPADHTTSKLPARDGENGEEGRWNYSR